MGSAQTPEDVSSDVGLDDVVRTIPQQNPGTASRSEAHILSLQLRVLTCTPLTPGAAFAQEFAGSQTTGTSRDSERAERIALGLESVGDSLQQGEPLPRDTNPLGIAARWFLHFVMLIATVR